MPTKQFSFSPNEINKHDVGLSPAAGLHGDSPQSKQGEARAAALAQTTHMGHPSRSKAETSASSPVDACSHFSNRNTQQTTAARKTRKPKVPTVGERGDAQPNNSEPSESCFTNRPTVNPDTPTPTAPSNLSNSIENIPPPSHDPVDCGPSTSVFSSDAKCPPEPPPVLAPLWASTVRVERWHAFTDFLLNELTRVGAQLLDTGFEPDARMDALKDLVSVAHRLYALHKSLHGGEGEVEQPNLRPAEENLARNLDELRTLLPRILEASGHDAQACD